MKNFFNNKWFIIPTLFLVFGAVAVIATTLGDSGFSGIQVDNYFSGSGRQGINQNVSFEDVDGNEHLLEFEDGLLVSYNVQEIPSEPNESLEFPLEGLMAYYDMEDYGGVLKDKLTIYNGTEENITHNEIAGKIGSGIISDSSGDLINVSSLKYGWDSNNWSFSGWANANSSNFIGGLFTNRPNYGGSSEVGYVTLGVINGIVKVEVNATTIFQQENSVGDDSWHHYVLIYDSRLSLYLDGVLVNSTSSFGKLGSDTPNQVWFGNWGAAPTQTWRGFLDEFGIWNRSLTESEIQALYNNGNGLPYPN